MRPAVFKLLTGFILTAVIVTSAVSVAPFVVDGAVLRKKLIDRLTDMTGGEVAIAGRVGLSSFTSLSIDAENVSVTGATKTGYAEKFTAKRIEGRIAWIDVIRGRAAFETLIVEGPVFEVAYPETVKHAAKHAMTRMFAMMGDAPLSEIVIRDGLITTPASGEPDAHTPVDVRSLRIKRDGDEVVVRGKLGWNRELITLRARRGAEELLGGQKRAPVELSLSGVPGRLRLAGALAHGDQTEFHGELQFFSADATQLPAWLQLPWSLPQRVDAVTADGTVAWSEGLFAVTAGRFSVNGYSADGNIAISSGGDCASVDGLLAFDTLSLDILISASAAENQPSQLLTCLNADMRLSTSRLAAGTLRMGSAAAAVTLKAGKAAIDIAELEVFNGLARGNVELDLTQAVPAVSIRMTAQDVDVSRVTEAVHLGSWLHGRGAINAEIRARGRTAAEIMATVTGQTKVTIVDGGNLGETAVGMLASAQMASLREASARPQLQTTFQTFKADLQAENGVITARSVDMTENDRRVTARGKIDMARKSLACTVTFRPSKAAGGMEKPHTLALDGPFDQPRITWNGQPVDMNDGILTGATPF